MLKLTLIFTCIGLSLSASTFSQTMSIKGTHITAEDLFNSINKQTGYAVVFDNELLAKMPTFMLMEENSALDDVLRKSLVAHGFVYTIKHNTIVITEGKRPLAAQQRKISGQIVDMNGHPVSFASIKISGNRVAAVLTDKHGTFSFDYRSGDRTMTISHMGFQEIKVDIKKDEDRYILKLQPKVSDLDGVVVTGIFDRPIESFTGSARIISKEDIKMNGNRNLLKTLNNIDPSFDIFETNTYGSDPNMLPNIEIRGTTSISSVFELQNSNNAYQNLSDRNLPLFILDGFEVTLQRVMDMNQADVEQVVILKDASAKAIYGSRGSNGVVVITSVRPEPGVLRIGYTGGTNLEIPDLSSYNLLDAKGKLHAEELAGIYIDNSNWFTHVSLQEEYQKNLRAVSSGVNTNWIEMPVRVGIGQYHKLDISGGDEKFKYILNGSYNQIAGAMKGSKRDNINGGFTLHYTGERFRISNTLNAGFNNAANSPYGRFAEYAAMNPYWSPVDENGVLTQTFGLKAKVNPLLAPNSTDFSTTDYSNIRNSTRIDWDIMKGLKFDASIGFTQQKGESDVFQSPNGPNHFNVTNIETKGRYIKGFNRMMGYQISSTLNYAKLIGLHSFYTGVNIQTMQSSNYRTQIIATGFLNDQMTDISYALKYFGNKPTTFEGLARTMGVTGNFNYNYASRYFVDFNYRKDGASSFGSESRWAPFWSVGAGWTLNNEKFFSALAPVLNTMRLRYTYGETGSMNFQPYDALTTYTYPDDVMYRYQRPTVINNYGNPNLQWQSTFENNLGLDLTAFNNKMTLVVNYYNKKTKNLVSEGFMTYSHGFTTYKENIGSIRNTGWDANGSFTLLRDVSKQLNWAVTAGLYNNKNVLVKLSDAVKEANAKYSQQNLSGGLIAEYREGQAIDAIYVLNSPGVDVLTGKVLYINSNGEIGTTTTGMDKIMVGHLRPKVNGRFGTNVSYKGFSMSVGFATRLGGQKLNSTLLNKVENANIIFNVDRRVLDTRWTTPGEVSAYKALGSEESTMANNRFIFTERTVTLNNVNIFYNFQERLISRMKLRRLSVGASMSDVFYWSNIEQERGLDYPYSLKPTFTLSASF